MIINYFRFLQFSLFRSPSSLKIVSAFYFYKKYLQLLNLIFYKNNINYEYNKYFNNKGFFKFSTSNSEKIAKVILKKIKKLEISDKNFWSKNGRASIKNLRHYFPELDRLFMGEEGLIIKSIFKSDYKIYYGVLNKSVGSKDSRKGSQLWHNDGGPGTCINMMFYLNDVDEKNGPLQIIDWNKSKKFFWHERKNLHKFRLQKTKDEYRKLRSEAIDNFSFSNCDNKFDTMIGKKGSVVLFSNNTYHRGGFPNMNRERIVFIFHLYPSNKPINQIFRKHASIEKLGSYPDRPNFNEK